jgi:hypothetical protein
MYNMWQRGRNDFRVVRFCASILNFYMDLHVHIHCAVSVNIRICISTCIGSKRLGNDGRQDRHMLCLLLFKHEKIAVMKSTSNPFLPPIEDTFYLKVKTCLKKWVMSVAQLA